MREAGSVRHSADAKGRSRLSHRAQPGVAGDRSRHHAGVGRTFARLRQLDERWMGPAVPKPPTVGLGRWPLFSYPDPWWAIPVWFLGIAFCLVVMRWSEWAGFAALVVIASVGTVTSTRD